MQIPRTTGPMEWVMALNSQSSGLTDFTLTASSNIRRSLRGAVQRSTLLCGCAKDGVVPVMARQGFKRLPAGLLRCVRAYPDGKDMEAVYREN